MQLSRGFTLNSVNAKNFPSSLKKSFFLFCFLLDQGQFWGFLITPTLDFTLGVTDYTYFDFSPWVLKFCHLHS